MTRSGIAMTALTTTGLVLAATYSAALGGDGWLWFAWVVLALTTAGVVGSSRGA